MSKLGRTVYYALYPGDFLADISDLGNTELGIYWRLTLNYYQHRQPLRGDLLSLYRTAMAFTPEEQDATRKVIERFFYPSTETKDGGKTVLVYRQKRCDVELEEADKRYESAVARTAKAREIKIKNSKASVTDSVTDPVTDPVTDSVTDSVTSSVKGSVTGGESESESELELELELELETPTPAVEKSNKPIDAKTRSPGAEAVLAMRDVGIHDGNPQHPLLLALLDHGAQVEDFVYAARDAVGRSPSKGFAYALRIVERRSQERLAAAPRMPQPEDCLTFQAATAQRGARWTRQIRVKGEFWVENQNGERWIDPEHPGNVIPDGKSSVISA